MKSKQVGFLICDELSIWQLWSNGDINQPTVFFEPEICWQNPKGTGLSQHKYWNWCYKKWWTYHTDTIKLNLSYEMIIFKMQSKPSRERTDMCISECCQITAYFLSSLCFQDLCPEIHIHLECTWLEQKCKRLHSFYMKLAKNNN